MKRIKTVKVGEIYFDENNYRYLKILKAPENTAPIRQACLVSVEEEFDGDLIETDQILMSGAEILQYKLYKESEEY